MSQALVKIETNKKALTAALESNSSIIVDRLPTQKEQQDFKENFLELAENSYLMEKVDPKHILTFALNVSKLGININPVYKEAYIVPFNVKDKGMMPTLIIPKQGIRQIAYDAGFYLEVDRVFNLNGVIVSQSDMNGDQLTEIKTTDSKWVEEHFAGFDISLIDLIDGQKKLPKQQVFVGAEYVKSVTKTMQDDRYKIQTWEHKACRRAFNDFFIPRGRSVTILDEVDKLNEENVIEADIVSGDVDIKDTLLNDKSDTVNIENVTVKTIMAYFTKHKGTDKGAKIEAEMKKQDGWRKYSQDKLNELYEALKEL